MLNALKTLSKLAAAYKIVAQVAGMVPPEQRKRLAEGFSALAETSQENLLSLLEKHAPGFIDKAVERNGGKALTKEDLEATMMKFMEQQGGALRKTARAKKPVLSVK